MDNSRLPSQTLLYSGLPSLRVLGYSSVNSTATALAIPPTSDENLWLQGSLRCLRQQLNETMAAGYLACSGQMNSK